MSPKPNCSRPLALLSLIIILLSSIRLSANPVTTKNKTLPEYFIENKGQLEVDKARFMASFGNARCYFDEGGLHYAFNRELADGSKESSQLKATFIGRNDRTALTASQRQAYYENHYTESKRFEGIATYQKLHYEELYEGIDGIFYFSDSNLKYDLIVQPQACTEDIRIRYEGMEDIRLDAEGNLVTTTALGEIKELKPYSYQEINGKRLTIPSKYKLNNNVLSFEIGTYDLDYPLVIDPVSFVMATYWGDGSGELFNDIVVDDAGNSIVTGRAGNGSGSDAVIVKFAPDNTVVWGMTFGGNNSENSRFSSDYGKITLDAEQNIYITGITRSSNLPVTAGVFQPNAGGNYDAFVAKFDSGGQLLKSSYIGGSSIENERGAGAIAVDADGNIFVAGASKSSDPFLNATGNYKPSLSAPSYAGQNSDAFILKISPDFATASGTFWGDTVRQIITDLKIDQNNKVWATGYTASTPLNLPGFQTATFQKSEAFLLKFSNDLTALDWGSFIGGNGDDKAYGLAIDENNEVIVTGSTTNPGNFLPSSPPLNSFVGGYEVFVVKVANNGDLVWTTFLGGGENDHSTDITVDGNDNIYVTGNTRSVDFPHQYTVQETYNTIHCLEDGFIAKLSPTGNREWGSFYGGFQTDFPKGIAVYNNQYIYIAGRTSSTDLPMPDVQPLSNNAPTAFIAGFEYACPATPIIIHSLENGLYYDIGNCSPSNPEHVYIEPGCGVSVIAPPGYSTYTWQLDGANYGGNTQVVSCQHPGALPDVYEVTVSGNGCAPPSLSIQDEISLHVMQCGTINQDENLPHPSEITGGYSDLVFCSSDSVSTKLNSGGHCYGEYQWQRDSVDIIGATGVSYDVTEPGCYRILTTNTVTGCTVYSRTKRIIALDSVFISDLNTDENCFHADTLGDCEPIELFPRIATCYNCESSIDGLTYEWQFEGNTVGTDNSHMADQSGTYTVNIYVDTICYVTSAPIEIIMPEIPITAPGPYCATDTIFFEHPYTYLASFTLEEPLSHAYPYTPYVAPSYHTDSSIYVVPPFEPGIYNIKMVNRYGCDTYSIDFEIHDELNFGFPDGCAPQNFNLFYDTDTYFNYVWYFTDILGNSSIVETGTGDNQSYQGNIPGEYVLEMTNQCGTFTDTTVLTGSVPDIEIDGAGAVYCIYQDSIVVDYFHPNAAEGIITLGNAADNMVVYDDHIVLYPPFNPGCYIMELNIGGGACFTSSVESIVLQDSLDINIGISNPLPNNNDNDPCGTTRLYASGDCGSSVSWFFGGVEVGSGYYHTTTGPGEYVAVVSNACGVFSDTIQIFDEPSSLLLDKHYCIPQAGDSLIINLNHPYLGQSGTTLTMIPGGTVPVNGNELILKPPLTAGCYRLRIANEYGCYELSNTFELHNENINLTTTSQCATTTLTSSKDSCHYEWYYFYRGNDLLDSGSGEDFLEFEADIPGLYILNYLTACGIIADTVEVVGDAPASISPAGPVCAPASLEITPPDDRAYFVHWYSSPTPISSCDMNGIGLGETSLVLQADNPGFYYVFLEDSITGCFTECSNIVEVQISTAGATLYPDDVFTCIGDSLSTAYLYVLPYSPTFTYEWLLDSDPIPNVNSNEYTTNETGVYEVIVSNACNSSHQTNAVTLAEVNPPTAEITPDSVNFCPGGTVQLEAYSPYDVTYSWYLGNTEMSPPETDLILETSIAGEYYVVITDTITGCVGTSDIATLVAGEMTLSPTVTPECQEYCDGTVSISVTGGTPYPDGSYDYINWDGELIEGLCPGSYTYGVTDAIGCTKTITVTIAPLLVVETTSTEVSCFGGNDGSITTIVTNGLAPFSYEWTNEYGANVAGGMTANNLPAGYYTVTVTDANDCSNYSEGFVEEPEPIELEIESPNNIQCHGDADQSIDLFVFGGSPFGGNYDYTYQWSGPGNYSPSPNQINMPAGTHTVTVTDARDCQKSISITIHQPDLLLGASTVNAHVSCYGYSDGGGTVTANGGTPPYSYLWYNGETTQTVTNLEGGTHTIIVSDANGCLTYPTINIPQPLPLGIVAFTIQPISCYGASDGSISTIISGGTAPYDYFWGNESAIDVGPSISIENLATGSYTLTVVDYNECIFVDSVELVQPDPLVITAMATGDVTCYSGSDGTAATNTTGGTPPYSYIWDNNETTANADSLAVGLHLVTVTDANGCTATTQTTIIEPDLLEVFLEDVSPVSCHGGSDGSISISTSGGIAPYTYLWSNNAIDQNPDSLTAGSYTLTVTDANGCTANLSALVEEPPPLSAYITMVDSVSCFDLSDGVATITATGGIAPYTYHWSNTVTTQTATNLEGDIYIATVTDANGCRTFPTVAMPEPLPLGIPTISSAPATCHGASDGSVAATVSGGTAPYLFTWSSNATDDLSSGIYYLTITDYNDCIIIDSVLVAQPDSLVISVDQQGGVSCFGGADGTTLTSTTGGTPPYSYSWDNGETTANADSLNAGLHLVTVTDAQGCTATTQITIIEPDLLELFLENVDSVSCYNGSDGSIDISTSGGTAPYSYLWSNTATDQNPNNLATGSYTLTVTDANGCTANLTAFVEQPPLLSAYITMVDSISCHGFSDGVATITATGGIAPYTYNWNGETTQTVTNLEAGIHIATVTDANGCRTFPTVAMPEPLPLGIPTISSDSTSCYGSSDGSATLTVTGGTTPYEYYWSNGATTTTITDLTAATYWVTVTDFNQCQLIDSILVKEPALLGASLGSTTAVTCHGLADGTAYVVGSGGTLPYQYQWDNGESTALANELDAGPHSVTVTDFYQCEVVFAVTISQPTSLIGTAVALSPVSCHGLSDGSATASASGGTAPYSYLWDNFENTATAMALNVGIHAVSITDANACQTIRYVAVEEPTALILTSATSENISCYGLSDGSISVTIAGGNSPYTYLWNTGETTTYIDLKPAGNYSLTATDSKGCIFVFDTTLTAPDLLQGTVVLRQHVSCHDGADGQAEALMTGGTLPYAYLWENGENGATAVFLAEGTHSLTVSDANGCLWTGAVLVEMPDPLGLVATVQTPVSCHGGNDGTASFSMTGGTTPYYYTLNGQQHPLETITDLEAGVHEIEIADANGCSRSVIQLTITEPELLSVSAEGLDPLCWGGEDGSAAVSVSGGTLGYSYQWNNGSTYPAPLGLGAGNYTVTVTDTNGCRAITSVQLSQPTLIANSFRAVDNVCYDYAEGRIEIIGTAGGMAPYLYSLDGSPYSPQTLFQNLASGSYELGVMDANGCEIFQQAFIEEPSEIVVDAGLELELVLGESGQLLANVNTTAPLSLIWEPSTYLVCENGDVELQCLDPLVLQPLDNQTYMLTVIDADGCRATDEVTVLVEKNQNVFVPNAFTPNNDGINDLFYIQTDQSVANIPILRIFDRWGELVFEAKDIPPNDYTYGWDGTTRGKAMNPAVFVYYFEVEFIDGGKQFFKGDITLVK